MTRSGANRGFSRGAVDQGEPRLGVRSIPAAVDFYLAVGCEVCLVDDGWVRLRQGDARFVLVKVQGARREPPSAMDLTSPDPDLLCRRLRALGIDTGAGAARGRLEVRDPDGNLVVISRTAGAPRARRPTFRDDGATARRKGGA
ncbi:hypothetical protein [Umezawaea tangerina]|uniref:VOC domain-containing protein n=1 Tax=Umezawaea tangerina TaxID=84725 RepID=A0A2T0T1P6_9PSEU|nr:hypothetical protein [Umezawaea tangerina]PRY39571.1 hypothetical protein CLV43_107154 [Umezawaea tangerina]